MGDVAGLFQAVFEHALDAVFIADDERRYVHVNPAACALLDLPPDRILGRRVEDFFEIDEAGESVPGAWEAFRESGAQSGVCRRRLPDGSVLYASFRAKANIQPGLHLSILRDITAQRAAANALRESNRYLTFLSSTAAQLLATKDPAELLRRILPEVARELGLDVYFNFVVDGGGSSLRLESYSGISPGAAQCLERLDLEQAAPGLNARRPEAAVIERVQCSTDPATALIRELGLQAYVSNPITAGTELIGALSFGARDRTAFPPRELELMRTIAADFAIAFERSRLIADLAAKNAQLERANNELVRANGELIHFAYAAGHDLRTPLRTIASFVELLGRRLGENDPEGRNYIAQIGGAISRMTAFMEDLLAYSQAQTRRDNIRPIDSGMVLQWALVNLNSAIEESGASITHDPLPEVCADQMQLVQVFQNLIGNAIKYHGTSAPRIHVGAEQTDDAVVFCVSDNGMGIRPEYHDRIFEVFRRLHGSEIPGAGLGLALCKRIVENHGGRIWVESEPGRGSIFRFTLPRS